MIDCAVILPAAGKGERFAAGSSASASKVEFELEGRAVFLRAIDLFHGRPEVRQIVLAVDPARHGEFVARWGEALSFLQVEVVPGGEAERWETVSKAMGRVDATVTHIAVHDAARPVTPKAVIDRVFAAAETCDAVIPGLPVSNTLKRVEERAEASPRDRVDDILGLGEETETHADQPRRVTETVPRADLVAVQTPQVFRAELLRDAYARLQTDGSLAVTDDAALVEAMGQEVVVVEGDPGNLKLTRPADAELLSALLRYRQAESKQADAIRDLFGDDEE